MVLFRGRLFATFERAMKITESVSILPFYWNSSKGRMEVTATRNQKIFVTGIWIQTVLLILCLVQAFLAWNKLNLILKSYSVFVYSILVNGLISTNINKQYSTLICTLLNSMKSYERSWCYGRLYNFKGKKTFLLEFTVITLTTVSFLGTPIFLSTTFVFPCLPHVLGHFLLDECANESPKQILDGISFQQILIKVGISVVGWANIQFFGGGALMHFWLLFLTSYGFRIYIQEYFG